jgi:hypothetical protein
MEGVRDSKKTGSEGTAAAPTEGTRKAEPRSSAPSSSSNGGRSSRKAAETSGSRREAS